jgi:hypothetical protein
MIDDLLADGGTLEQTHISWVVLRGEEAWKIKKPVSLGFLDFSTPELRRAACEAEVRLNRRLAPGVYLGCEPITRDAAGRHHLGGEDGAGGEVVDWAVRMVRLDHHDRADVRLAEGRLSGEQLARVAERLSDFHAAARRDETTARYGTVEAIRGNVVENFEQTVGVIERHLTGEQIQEIEGWQLDFLARHADGFEQRLAAGRVCEGHGDLRLEHVYLRDDTATSNDAGLAIVDCIEFNQRFRHADVCADVAFLAMDLTWHDQPALAERFLAAYARAADDFELYPLVDFYESYRAFVRAKVSAMTAADPGIATEARRRASEQARRYFLLALASERRPLQPARVVAVGGVIASGKSTVANRLCAALAAPVVDSDRTRKSLLGVEPEQPVHVAAWQGGYSPAATRDVYAEVVHRADAVLRSGRTVIVDASFRAATDRTELRRLAERHGVPFLFVECRASAERCKERLREREMAASVSDGRLEIFDDFVARWEPVEELPPGEHLVVDTERSPEQTLATVLAALGESTVPSPSSATSRRPE